MSDQDIQISIHSYPNSRRVNGSVLVGGAEVFRCVGEYDPRNTGSGLSYPWRVHLVNKENIPQRFMTFEGMLAEVKALTLRQFDLLCQEQSQHRVNEELAAMAEALTW